MSPRPRLSAGLALASVLFLARAASPQGFNGVYSPDGIDVIAVGDGGKIYRSLNSGFDWFQQTLGAGTLRDVAGRGFKLVTVGDAGAVYTSVDNGGNWTLTTLPGSPTVRCVALPTNTAWYVAGDGGIIYKSTDQGANWVAQSSGTGVRLYKLSFTDGQHGWVAGESGTLLSTTNGGTTWNPVSLGTPNHLYGVEQKGSTVWVVGAEGTAFKSVDGGANFSPANLKLDARADVKAVAMEGPDTVWVAGGGGFIRFSTDGGASWQFQQHKMHAPITDLAAYGNYAMATNSLNRIVTFTTDTGNFWRLPTGCTLSRSWGSNPKYLYAGYVRGSTFALNPVYKSTMYCVLGDRVMRTRDDGESWALAANIPSAYNRCNAFIVSPKDSNLWLAAVAGGTVADRVLRTVNAGAKWDTVLTHDFGEYGIPLEMDPDHPDTVYFGGELSPVSTPPLDTLHVSFNFGQTWQTVGGGVFRSPCDIVAVPDHPGMLIVADGVTGSGTGKVYKSVDGGVTFTQTGTGGSSEIPGMANSRLRPATVVHTNWISGGAKRSIDFGDTWQTVDTSMQAWGIDVAKDDPNVWMFGQYSGNPLYSFLSLDGGATFTSVTTPSTFGNNYGFYLRDRATMFAEQSSGIWKLSTTYNYTPISSAQAITVAVPNGGEVLTPGTTYTISWTALNVALARIEYRRAPGEPWQWIADVGGYYQNYNWTVPFDGTHQAKVRVYDVWDGAPEDSSDAEFTITAPRVAETPDPLDFGLQSVGDAVVLPITLENVGVTPLNISNIVATPSEYVVGRTTLTLAPGGSDTVGVWFIPDENGSTPGDLTITSNDVGHTPIHVALSGEGTGATVALTSPNGGETWQYNSVHNITWSAVEFSNVDLMYRVSPDSAWIPIALDLPSSPTSYAWTIPFHPSATAEVRVRNPLGAPSDRSDAVFSLTSPLFGATPDTLRLVAQVGSVVDGPIQVDDPGTAPLSITSVAIPPSEFWPGRTSFIVPTGGSDTVRVFYQPAEAGNDTAVVTFSADDPGASHTRVVIGHAVVDLAVGPEARFGFALRQNQPNPFSRSTFIAYTLPRDAEVSLDVFDLAGHRVATLAKGRQAAGQHHVSFGIGAGGPDAVSVERLAAGVYFYRLAVGSFATTRRMLLVR